MDQVYFIYYVLLSARKRRFKYWALLRKIENNFAVLEKKSYRGYQVYYKIKTGLKNTINLYFKIYFPLPYKIVQEELKSKKHLLLQKLKKWSMI